MNSSENRRKLFNHLRDEMKEDRAKHKILPPSKFGLIQITRQRVRPEMNIKTKEINPNGPNGLEIEAPIVLIDKFNHQLDLIAKKGLKKVILNLHPFVAAFLTKGFMSIRLRWYFKYKIWVKIMPRDAYTYLEYRFKSDKGKTIKL
jgi:ribonuclease G